MENKKFFIGLVEQKETPPQGLKKQSLDELLSTRPRESVRSILTLAQRKCVRPGCQCQERGDSRLYRDFPVLWYLVETVPLDILDEFSADILNGFGVRYIQRYLERHDPDTQRALSETLTDPDGRNVFNYCVTAAEAEWFRQRIDNDEKVAAMLNQRIKNKEKSAFFQNEPLAPIEYMLNSAISVWDSAEFGFVPDVSIVAWHLDHGYILDKDLIQIIKSDSNYDRATRFIDVVIDKKGCGDHLSDLLNLCNPLPMFKEWFGYFSRRCGEEFAKKSLAARIPQHVFCGDEGKIHFGIVGFLQELGLVNTTNNGFNLLSGALANFLQGGNFTDTDYRNLFRELIKTDIRLEKEHLDKFSSKREISQKILDLVHDISLNTDRLLKGHFEWLITRVRHDLLDDDFRAMLGTRRDISRNFAERLLALDPSLGNWFHPDVRRQVELTPDMISALDIPKEEIMSNILRYPVDLVSKLRAYVDKGFAIDEGDALKILEITAGYSSKTIQEVVRFLPRTAVVRAAAVQRNRERLIGLLTQQQISSLPVIPKPDPLVLALMNDPSGQIRKLRTQRLRGIDTLPLPGTLRSEQRKKMKRLFQAQYADPLRRQIRAGNTEAVSKFRSQAVQDKTFPAPYDTVSGQKTARLERVYHQDLEEVAGEIKRNKWRLGTDRDRARFIRWFDETSRLRRHYPWVSGEDMIEFFKNDIPLGLTKVKSDIDPLVGRFLDVVSDRLRVYLDYPEAWRTFLSVIDGALKEKETVRIIRDHIVGRAMDGSGVVEADRVALYQRMIVKYLEPLLDRLKKIKNDHLSSPEDLRMYLTEEIKKFFDGHETMLGTKPSLRAVLSENFEKKLELLRLYYPWLSRLPFSSQAETQQRLWDLISRARQKTPKQRQQPRQRQQQQEHQMHQQQQRETQVPSPKKITAPARVFARDWRHVISWNVRNPQLPESYGQRSARQKDEIMRLKYKDLEKISYYAEKEGTGFVLLQEFPVPRPGQQKTRVDTLLLNFLTLLNSNRQQEWKYAIQEWVMGAKERKNYLLTLWDSKRYELLEVVDETARYPTTYSFTTDAGRDRPAIVCSRNVLGIATRELYTNKVFIVLNVHKSRDVPVRDLFLTMDKMIRYLKQATRSPACHVIVAGDFNAAQPHIAPFTTERRWRDVFPEHGDGRPDIDGALCDTGLRRGGAVILSDVAGSDHDPIVFSFF